jgi:hypothetical protein
MKQKMLLMTFFYNPAVIDPEAICESAGLVTEEALFAGIEECVTQGGVVRVGHVEADLVRLACGQNGCPLAHEWVGLTFVPVQLVAPVQAVAPGCAGVQEVVIMKEVVDAY